MRIEKFGSNALKDIQGKKIYCYEKSISYLKDLIEQYDVIGQIDLIIDDSVRNQGFCEFNGKKISVRSFAVIEQIDWTNSTILITSDYYMEAYEKLREELSEKLSVIYYFENQETAYEMKYRSRFQDKALKNIILFRSGPHAASYIEGTDFSDNARALFEYMLADGYNETYELVWLVKAPNAFTKYCQKNVTFLSFDWSVSEVEEERERYYRALCLAKYIFFTDAYGFARNCRPDQIRVQLWHGCGFKTRVNFVRCQKRYEFMTVISDLYAEIHEQIYGLKKEQLLVTGYAKQDWLFETKQKQDTDWLNIPEGYKCIFWLPTFRTANAVLSNLSESREISDTGLPVVDTFQKMKILNALLAREKIMMLVKLHPFQDKASVHCGKLSNIVLLDNHELFVRDIQINQLLPIADALISDYSSAAVDYMLLNRPIAFTLDDVDEYAENRGFIFEPIRDWFPGKELLSFDEFCGFISEVSNEVDSTKEKREYLRKKMHKFHDGENCKRILEALGIDKKGKTDHGI